MIVKPSSALAASVHPPAISELDASNCALPSWILLDTRVYFDHLDNSTTAEAETSRGHAIQVSVCLADPPARSHVCIHCPGLTASHFVGEPRVLRSEKQLLLLHLPLLWSTNGVLMKSSEYYVYQAMQGQKPTLSRIPDPGSCRLLADDFGIYCGDAGEYIVAGLSWTR